MASSLAEYGRADVNLNKPITATYITGLATNMTYTSDGFGFRISEIDSTTLRIYTRNPFNAVSGNINAYWVGFFK